eukprot:6202703-Pleurochrysis_carterae.AAC.2
MAGDGGYKRPLLGCQRMVASHTSAHREASMETSSTFELRIVDRSEEKSRTGDGRTDAAAVPGARLGADPASRFAE